MKIIRVKLILEDANNLSNEDAIRDVIEILNEAFGKEATHEYPRVKLILMDVKHGLDRQVYFCVKCNQHFESPFYCIHKYNPEAPKLNE